MDESGEPLHYPAFRKGSVSESSVSKSTASVPRPELENCVKPLRILIADDHELIRRGLRSLLSSHTGWEVCGEAKDGVEAVQQTKRLQPDVLVLDITMPNMNGLEAARTIRKDGYQPVIVILSQHDPREMSGAAIKAGAQGYVSKSEVATELLGTIEHLTQDDRPPASSKFGPS